MFPLFECYLCHSVAVILSNEFNHYALANGDKNKNNSTSIKYFEAKRINRGAKLLKQYLEHSRHRALLFMPEKFHACFYKVIHEIVFV